MNFRFARFLARALPNLACMAMMLLALAPQSSAYWQCEGQICGTSAWTCCCTVGADEQDPNCEPLVINGDHFETAAHSQEMGSCPAKCHCSVVAQAASRSFSSLSDFGPAHFVCLPVLPFSFVPENHSSNVQVPPMESRGPPPNAVFFASPSLRAPPLA